MAGLALNPYSQFLDNAGLVLSNGTLTFNVNNTATISTIFTDRTATVAQSNPYTLDASGRLTGDVYYSGLKRMIVKDSTGATVRTLDDVTVLSDLEDEFAKTFGTVAEMVAVTDLEVGEFVITAEYASGQGGGNSYEVVAAATGTADGGSFIDLSSGGSFQAKALFPSVMNVAQYGAVGDGSTDDTTAIQAAVTRANTLGASLRFAAGSYLTISSITNLHAVDKSGTGSIKRGSDVFFVDLGTGLTNDLFVSTSGNDTNDGLSSSEAFLTGQAGVDAWATYATAAKGEFTLNLGSGTYTEGIEIDGIRSAFELIIDGGDKTLTTLDGAGASKNFAINFNDGTIGRVKNLKTQAFNQGIAFQNGSLGVIDTCDADNHSQFAFNATENTDMNIIGDCTITVPVGGRGIRYYRNSTGSLTQSGDTLTIDCGGLVADGMDIRNGSEVVQGSGNIIIDDSANVAILIRNAGFLELRTSTLSNNVTAIKIDDLSRLAEVGTVTFTANTTDRSFSGFGILEGLTQNTLIGRDDVSGDSSSSPYDLIIDNNGQSGFQALTNANTFNIDVNKTERIGFVPSDNSLRFSTNNVERFRMRTNAFIPLADDTYSCGEASFLWSEIFAGNGSINTSDERRKTTLEDLSATELAVATELKSAIKKFKFTNAIEKKGDSARIHFGVGAQTVKAIFTSHGLDAHDYSLFCYDEWEEVSEGGKVVTKAGNRYGIRYEQLLAFIIAAL